MKHSLYCSNNTVPAKTGYWKAGAGSGDYFLSFGCDTHWVPLVLLGPAPPVRFLHGAGSLCRNVTLGAKLGPLWPTFKIQNRL